jgi:hypothetical protein
MTSSLSAKGAGPDEEGIAMLAGRIFTDRVLHSQNLRPDEEGIATETNPP